MHISKHWQQKSPPAWTQEAYRPRRIKYHPRWGTPPIRVPSVRVPPWPGLMGSTQGGVLPLLGYPPARSDGEGGTQGRVPPSGYPRPGLTGGYLRWGTPIRESPSEVWQGVPEVGYPLLGYPPAGPGWSNSPPPPGWTQPGYPPPPPQVWTDRRMDWWTRHVSKHNLPSYYVRGR